MSCSLVARIQWEIRCYSGECIFNNLIAKSKGLELASFDQVTRWFIKKSSNWLLFSQGRHTSRYLVVPYRVSAAQQQTVGRGRVAGDAFCIHSRAHLHTGLIIYHSPPPPTPWRRHDDDDHHVDAAQGPRALLWRARVSLLVSATRFFFFLSITSLLHWFPCQTSPVSLCLVWSREGRVLWGAYCSPFYLLCVNDRPPSGCPVSDCFVIGQLVFLMFHASSHFYVLSFCFHFNL